MELVNLCPEAGLIELSTVEKGPDGLPCAWPMLRAGDNFLTLQGRSANLKLTAADVSGIVDYHKAKGAKIPLDSRHVISNLAKKLGIDEAELLRRMPRLAGTAGFGALEQRDGALWLSDVEWLPIAAGALKEGMIRYFSPTIKGLDGKSPLRVTSVALDNEPCLQGIASLAASEADDDDPPITPDTVREAISKLTPNKEAVTMPEETNAPVIPGAEAAAKGNDGELLGILKEVLGENVTPENLKALLAALKVKADQLPEIKKQLDQLQLAEDNRNLEAARTKALTEGKLTAAMLEKDFFKNMTAAELSEYCNAMEPIVPLETLELSERGAAPKIEQPSGKVYSSVEEAIANAPTF